MKYCNSLLILILSLFLFSCSGGNSPLELPTPAPKQKPNIIIIYTDDMGWQDLNLSRTLQVSENSNDVKLMHNSNMSEAGQSLTPTLDELASKGILFTQAYANTPKCTPSRAALLTGLYPPHKNNKLYEVNGENKGTVGVDLPTNTETIADYLKGKGYRTISSGKWHLQKETLVNPDGTLNQADTSFPLNMGFDVNVGGGAGGAPVSYMPIDGEYRIQRNGVHEALYYQDSELLEKLVPPDQFTNMTDIITDTTVDLILNHDSNTPLFLYFSTYDAHFPTPDKCATEGVRRPAEAYKCMVNNTDIAISKIINALKESGIYENSYIIYTQDNGTHVDWYYPYGRRHGETLQDRISVRDLLYDQKHLNKGKAFIYEGGIRQPLIISGPNIQQEIIEEPVIQSDLFSVIRGVVENKSSFKALVKNKPLYFYNAFGGMGSNIMGAGSMAIRFGDYKLISNFYPHYDQIDEIDYLPLELYDLKNDISESCNLLISQDCQSSYGEESVKEIAADLSQKLCSWLNQEDHQMTIEDVPNRQKQVDMQIPYQYVSPEILTTGRFELWTLMGTWDNDPEAIDWTDTSEQKINVCGILDD